MRDTAVCVLRCTDDHWEVFTLMCHHTLTLPMWPQHTCALQYWILTFHSHQCPHHTTLGTLTNIPCYPSCLLSCKGVNSALWQARIKLFQCLFKSLEPRGELILREGNHISRCWLHENICYTEITHNKNCTWCNNYSPQDEYDDDDDPTLWHQVWSHR